MSLAPGLNDLGTTVPLKVKICNLRRTKNCASFRLKVPTSNEQVFALFINKIICTQDKKQMHRL